METFVRKMKMKLIFKGRTAQQIQFDHLEMQILVCNTVKKSAVTLDRLWCYGQC